MIIRGTRDRTIKIMITKQTWNFGRSLLLHVLPDDALLDRLVLLSGQHSHKPRLDVLVLGVAD